MQSLPSVRYFDRATPPHILTLVMLAGLGAMNMSVFLPALPHMTEYFQTDYAVMQLSVSLYLAATAVLQLLVGPLADHYGRRSVILIFTVIFILATIGCLFSTTVEMFLAFRMLQVSVSAGIVLSRAIVSDMYPPEQSASKIGYVMMGMALIPMVAPMIGGALDQMFGWHSVFVVLVVAGIVVWTVLFFDLGETKPRGNSSFRKQISEYPELFRSFRFWGYALSAAFASGAFFAFLGGAPYVASEVYGLSSFWAGMAFGAPGVGYALGNYLSGRYSARIGINGMILTGILAVTSGLGLSAVLTAIGYGAPFVFFGFCTMVGLGNGLIIPNASAGTLAVRPHLAGTASGIGGAIMIGGGAALSVLAGIVVKLGTTSLPLQLLMLGSALGALVSILFVRHRERVVGRQIA